MQPLDLNTIARAVQALHLATPLEAAETFSVHDDAASARRVLESRQFDAAPVLSGDVPIGVFRRAAVGEGPLVGDEMVPLNATLMVSGDTSLGELVGHLREEPFLFVLEGRRVVGFVTPADLGSAAGRTHYYLLLAALEITLANLVRHAYPEPGHAVALLSEGSRKRHEQIATELRTKDEFIDDIAALSLADMLHVAATIPGFRVEASSSGRSWAWLKRSLVGFRNDVMHPVRDFGWSSGPGIAKLAEFDERLVILIRTAETLLP